MAARKLEETPRPKFKAGTELRSRVLEAASQLFAEEGYQNVSIRRIAQVAGCSQMAMYRHFPDKAALIRHLCVELYTNLTDQLHDKLDLLEDPKERLFESGRRFLELSIKNPHHYRLTFLTPLPDEGSMELRTGVAIPAIAYFRKNLKLSLPANTPEDVLEEKLRLSFACLHGLAVLLTTYPKAYGISKQKAFRDFEAHMEHLIRR